MGSTKRMGKKFDIINLLNVLIDAIKKNLFIQNKKIKCDLLRFYLFVLIKYYVYISSFDWIWKQKITKITKWRLNAKVNQFIWKENNRKKIMKNKCPKCSLVLYTWYKCSHRCESIAKQIYFYFTLFLNDVRCVYACAFYFLLCTFVVISSKAASWIFNIKLLADKNTLFCEFAICATKRKTNEFRWMWRNSRIKQKYE